MEEEKKWMPKIGGKYYIVVNNHVGGQGVRKKIWENSELDHCIHKKGECFKTKREATFVFKMFGKAWQ